MIRNRRWIQRHLYFYSFVDSCCLWATDFHYICRFRSGIQFLVDDFSDISFRFDQILKNFKCGDFLYEYNDLDEFDCTLHRLKRKHVLTHKHYLPPRPFHTPSSIPKQYWWWFWPVKMGVPKFFGKFSYFLFVLTVFSLAFKFFYSACVFFLFIFLLLQMCPSFWLWWHENSFYVKIYTK